VALDEPFESPIALVQYLLMQEARRHGVKVVLNGHGSDELLAGYPGSAVPGFLAQILRSGGLLRYFREAQAFALTGEWSTDDVLLEVLRSIIPTSLRPLIEESLRALVQHDTALFPEAGAVIRRMRPRRDATVRLRGSQLSLLTTTLWSLLTMKILPMWLRMEDRVSMAHAVESRLPFTDYRLVEFVLTLPDDLKLKHGYTKYILRQAVQDLLPPEIVLRRQKTRFSCPYSQWFRGSWRPLITDLFLSGPFKLDRCIQVPEFRRRLQAYLDGRPSGLRPQTLWRMLNTEIWMRTLTDVGTSQQLSQLSPSAMGRVPR
jgi:asparagine synthase (glutamine-hydrolysing)